MYVCNHFGRNGIPTSRDACPEPREYSDPPLLGHGNTTTSPPRLRELGNGKSTQKKPTQRISEGVKEGVQKGGFGARILYVGISSPSKTQRIKNFKGGGVSESRGGILGVVSLCLCAFSGLEEYHDPPPPQVQNYASPWLGRGVVVFSWP